MELIKRSGRNFCDAAIVTHYYLFDSTLFYVKVCSRQSLDEIDKNLHKIALEFTTKHKSLIGRYCSSEYIDRQFDEEVLQVGQDMGLEYFDNFSVTIEFLAYLK